MKQGLFLVLLMTTLWIGSAYAADEFDQLEKDLEKIGSSSSSAAAGSKSSPKLADVGGSRIEDRFDEIERRVNNIEQDLRFLNDRVRSLDRTVSDVRRKL